MKANHIVFLEPEVDDLCYLMAQAIARVLEKGSGEQLTDLLSTEPHPEEEPTSVKQGHKA